MLEHLFYTKSVATHYRVLRSMIAKSLDLTQVKLNRCLDVLRFLVKKMPVYPEGMVQPLNDNTLKVLNDRDSELLSNLLLKNPAFGANSRNPVVILSCQIGRLIALTDSEEFREALKIMSEDICQSAKQNPRVVGKLVETVLAEDRAIPEFFELALRLMRIVPEQMIGISQLPLCPIALSNLTPLGFIDPRDITLPVFVGTMRLHKFAFKAVKDMCTLKTVPSVITCHRLTLSGSAALEALMCALHHHHDLVWREMTQKGVRSDVKLTFGAVICCLMNCVELPQLKKLIYQSHPQIRLMLEQCIAASTDMNVRSTFLKSLMMLEGHGTTPLAQVYAKWMNPRYAIPIRQLMTCSPIDPSFPTLLTEMTPEVALDFQLVVEVTRKLFFTGPSMAGQAVMKRLAKTVDYARWVKFCASLVNSIDFVPAVHLWALSEKCPEIRKDEQSEIMLLNYRNIIVQALFSESYIIGDVLADLHKYMRCVMDKYFQSIMHVVSGNERSFMRLAVLVTLMPDFCNILLSVEVVMKEFLLTLQKIISKAVSDTNAAGALCIAWHNMCLSVKKPVPQIAKMIKDGADTLCICWAKNPALDSLITQAFLEVIELPNPRQIILEALSRSTKREPRIYDKMKQIDSVLANKYIPGWKSTESREEESVYSGTISYWGADYWKQYLYGGATTIYMP